MTLKYRYLTADVFTERRFGGNPLAVFPEAAGLSDAQMQTIARELALSETAFVVPAKDPKHTFALRIFTPAVELPFAGHPTIGAAIVLALIGKIAKRGTIVFEERAGPVAVTLDDKAAALSATLRSPKLPQRVPGAVTDSAALAAVMGLQPDAFGPPADGYSAGVPFLFVPVATERALAAITISLAHWQSVLAASPAPHVFAMTMDDWTNGRHVIARMFAPAMGIAEDPATGGAAAALAGFLCDRQGVRTTAAWTIDQGREMGRPSRLDLRATFENNALSHVEVGGSAVLVSDGTMFVD
jgi:trans-2,3-dihydro-3-hydroxyanthranilate isomerase